MKTQGNAGTPPPGMNAVERILWAAALATAVVWGMRGISGGTAAEDGGNGRTSMAGTLSPSLPPHGTHGRPDRSVPTRGMPAADTGSRVRRLLETPDKVRRMAGFAELVETADEAALHRISAAMEAARAAGAVCATEESLLEYRKGQVMGAALLSGRTGSAEDVRSAGTLAEQYEGWAHTDPTAATRWLERLPAGKFRDQMVLAHINCGTGDDPGTFARLAGTLHPSKQAEAGAALGRMLSSSPGNADMAHLLETMTEGGVATQPWMESTFETLAATCGAQGTGGAMRLMERNLDEPYVTKAALARVSARVAAEDPAAALDWAVEIENKKQSLPVGSVVHAAVSNMTLDGLDKASEWSAARAGEGWQGLGWLDTLIHRRRNLLEDRGGDHNEYDPDD